MWGYQTELLCMQVYPFSIIFILSHDVSRSERLNKREKLNTNYTDKPFNMILLFSPPPLSLSFPLSLHSFSSPCLLPSLRGAKEALVVTNRQMTSNELFEVEVGGACGFKGVKGEMKAMLKGKESVRIGVTVHWWAQNYILRVHSIVPRLPNLSFYINMLATLCCTHANKKNAERSLGTRLCVNYTAQ